MVFEFRIRCFCKNIEICGDCSFHSLDRIPSEYLLHKLINEPLRKIHHKFYNLFHENHG